MKPTYNINIFWRLWILSETAIASSCVYDVIMTKILSDGLFVFVACQPLMVLLPFFLKRHRSGAVTNIIVACIYVAFCCCSRFTAQSASIFENWGWFIFLPGVSVLQFILLTIYWGIEIIVKTCLRKSATNPKS